MYFQNFELRKKWVDKYLKTTVSEDPSTSNMVNEPKHIWNLDDSMFTIFVDYCEGDWVKKSLF